MVETVYFQACQRRDKSTFDQKYGQHVGCCKYLHSRAPTMKTSAGVHQHKVHGFAVDVLMTAFCIHVIEMLQRNRFSILTLVVNWPRIMWRSPWLNGRDEYHLSQ